MKTSVIVNFDHSVNDIEYSLTINLTDWQNDICFACSMSRFKQFKSYLDECLSSHYGPVLLGSGDYHYI